MGVSGIYGGSDGLGGRQKYDFWWREDSSGLGENMADAIYATVQYLDREQEHHSHAHLHHMRLYSNRLASGLNGSDYSVRDDGERIKLNVIKSVIDAAAAQIATNRPRPMYTTTGGNYSQRLRAKRLNKYVAGQFYATKQYDVGLSLFFDAAIFGTGFEHVYSENGRICAERVFPSDIIVDDIEARNGPPRQMFRHMEVDRAVLMERFGTSKKLKHAIENAALIRTDTSLRMGPSDRCSVVAAWHLPSSETADDGVAAIAVSGAVLHKRPWVRSEFPIVPFRITDAPQGYHGIGFAEELTPIQIEINYIAQKLQMLMNLATTQIWTRKGDGIGKVDNENMGVRTYKTTPPVAMNIRPAASEFFQHLWALYDRAFAITGVSQLAAQAQKPAGLNSGEALRTYNDINSRRFQHVGQKWEQFHIDVADRMIAEAREIAESGDTDGLRVLAGGDGDVEEIRFEDVSIEKDKYVTKVWPVSLLPETPQGKIQTIVELAQADPRIGAHASMLLTGIPDLEGIVNRINAPYDLVNLYLENMLERGVYEPPLPYMDLQLAQQECQLRLLQAHKDKVDESRLDLLRRFLDESASMVEMAQMAAPEAMGAPAPAPDLPGAAPATVPGGPAAAVPPGIT